MQVTDLPMVNAGLNGLAAVLLVIAYILVRRRRYEAHRNCMLAACLVSAAFLSCYLYYHAHVGSVPFQGTGWLRTVYFTILISHTILAAAVPFLAAITLYRAFRARYPAHRAIARWTLPIWLYVSVTGVVIYLMLYRLGV